jgi:hypothetical protein
VRWWFPGRWVGLPHRSAGSAGGQRKQHAG